MRATRGTDGKDSDGSRQNLNWDRKAQMVTQILCWAVQRGSRPEFPPPEILYLERAS
jgi:hypothetical protein